MLGGSPTALVDVESERHAQHGARQRQEEERACPRLERCGVLVEEVLLSEPRACAQARQRG